MPEPRASDTCKNSKKFYTENARDFKKIPWIKIIKPFEDIA
jgi:hypothetical protein